MIDTREQLEDLIDRARQAGRVALDTEFVWERTYYAGLGLVQLGLSRDEVYLIDTVAINDLRSLGALIEAPDVVKVLHDAQQDLMILYRATGGKPRSIFDTRLAGGFVGLTATTSLQALVEATVGVHLPKGESRSDWLRRPLREAQLEYARDDVRYLPEAYDALWAQIDARGRRAWVEEEMAQYDDLSLYTENDPRERYRHVKGRGKRGFSSLDYAVLRELAAWRELEARHRDRPRGHIVKDDALVALADRKPTSTEAVRDVQGVSDNAVRNYGGAIVDSVERGLAVPKEDRPKRNRRRRKDEAELARYERTQTLIKGRSAREDIDPGLIGNRASIERLVAEGPDADPEDHPVLRGWRRTFVGEDVLDILRGSTGEHAASNAARDNERADS